MHIGRVVGNRVMEIRFRTRFTENLQVGELLVIEEEGEETKYFVRVMDVEHGADADRDDWVLREAGEMLHKDSRNESPDIKGIEGRLYRVGVCTPLGYSSGNSFRKTKSIPSHFSKVRRATEEDYAFLRRFLGDIEVGKLRSGDRVLDFPVGISGLAFPHHIGIFATTGMGKSNLMKNLALSCMKLRRYGFLIFDPHGEYFDGGEIGKKGLRHAGMNEALEVFSSRELEGGYTTLKLSAKEIEIADLQNLYEFSQPQIECLQTAQFFYGENWLQELNSKSVDKICEDLGDRFHEGTINVIKRRLESIFRFGLITSDPKLSITKHVIECLHNAKVVLIDTSNLYEAEELLVSTVISRAIFERNKFIYGKKEEFERIPPVLIAMEEAQRVLGQSKGSIFAQIAREGRKFKVGLCAVSQQPKLIDPEIISQFNTLFILGLADRRDRDILRNSAKQDVSQLDNEIQTLMPGEAIIASPFTPFAIPVKIHLFEEFVSREGIQETGTKGVVSSKPRAEFKFF
ncbi:MAG: ATP-binding protein [Methanomassiliicoccales archaeon]|jgi:DNA helicase HerA-like ATPase|nr:ATP-binding protein [Methanomassiliicoccales archaeon]